MSVFNVVIRLGVILAVVVLCFHKLDPFFPNESTVEKKDTWTLWFRMIITCVPAVIIGLPLDDWSEANLHKLLPVVIILIVYDIASIIVEKRNKNRISRWTSLSNFTYQAALLVGLFQVLALILGTSCSGATVLRSILIGALRFVATEFSFFSGVLVMFGVSGLKIVKCSAEGNLFKTEEIVVLFIGAFVSFVVPVLAIKLLLSYLEKNDFTAFGWHRIILGIILIGYWFIAMWGKSEYFSYLRNVLISYFL